MDNKIHKKFQFDFKASHMGAGFGIPLDRMRVFECALQSKDINEKLWTAISIVEHTQIVLNTCSEIGDGLTPEEIAFLSISTVINAEKNGVGNFRRTTIEEILHKQERIN